MQATIHRYLGWTTSSDRSETETPLRSSHQMSFLMHISLKYARSYLKVGALSHHYKFIGTIKRLKARLQIDLVIKSSYIIPYPLFSKFFQSFTPLRPLSRVRDGKTYLFSINVHGIFRFRIALGSCTLTSLISLDINSTVARKIAKCNLLYGLANYHPPQRYHQTSLN